MKNITAKHIGLVMILIVMFGNTSVAQELNYKVHAMFVYHFTKYVSWPESKKSGDFVIGVYGHSEIIEELQLVASTKKAGTQTIVIKKLTSTTDFDDCHIIFVPENKSGDFDKISQTISGRPTLLITEKTGYAKKGSSINFITSDNKLRFEINKSAIESQSLKVSSELQKLGIVI